MKVKCELEMDLKTGKYKIKFINLDSKEDIEYAPLRNLLFKVILDWDERMKKTKNRTIN